MNKNCKIKSNEIQNKKLKPIKQSSIAMALLPLAACGGGGGGPTPAAGTPPAPEPTPTPTPDPDFIESPTNVFIALDNNSRTLSEGSSTANLTVTGKSGNDSITTGSGSDIIKGGAGNDTINANNGNDLIHAGTGRDTVNAGGGNDAIVVIGTTTASQYDNADITSAGGGYNLSDLITLAELNGRSVSEIASGEVIDGGTGTNTLFIYGTVDLTGVTLSNVTILEVHSDVTLTPEQLAHLTTVNGDGTSTINIEVDPGDTLIIDLSTLNISDLSSLNIGGDVTFIIDDASDLNGITSINTDDTAQVTLEIDGTSGNSSTTVNLNSIANVIDNVDTILLDTDIILVADNSSDITDLGLTEITGSGTIDTGGNSDAEAELENIEINIIYAGADSFNATEDNVKIINFDQLLSNDYADAPGDLEITNIQLTTASMQYADMSVDYDLGIISITPHNNYNGSLNFTYILSDSESNTETATATISVSNVNDLPTGYGSTARTELYGSRELSLTGSIFVDDFEIDVDGERLVLGDVDSGTIYIRVESISGGTITRNGSTVTEFTYNDVSNRLIEFEHDGSASAPTLTLSFSNDGTNWGNEADVYVAISNNEDIYTVYQGGSVGTNFTIPLGETNLLDGEDKFFGTDDSTAIFTNNGQIEAYGIGYLTPIYSINAETITNNGLIEVDHSSDNGTAVYMTGTGNFINNGMIKVIGGGYYGADPVYSFGVYSSDITNSGTVYVVGDITTAITATSGITLDNSGNLYSSANLEAYGMFISYGSADITNSGTIIVQNEDTSIASVGIDLYYSIGAIENSGIIIANTAIKANYGLDLTNSGEIHGDINLLSYNNIIVNTGEINGNISSGSSSDYVDNQSGQILGIVDLGGGTDFYFGSSNTDYVNGGSGNDLIDTGSGGDDRIYGGTGNDLINMASLSFSKIDGGTGEDSVFLAIDNGVLNFKNFDADKIQNIEEFYLDALNTSLTINAEHVIAITDEDNTLLIGGDANDIVNSDSDWTRGDSQVIEATSYRTYTSGDATILIGETVTFSGNILNPPAYTFSINDVETYEATETATFTVTISDKPYTSVTVDYLAQDGSNGTLTFNPGETEKTIEITWTDDATKEVHETINVTISNPSVGTIIDDTGILTILDEDDLPSISINDISSNEINETDTFTVSLSQIHLNDVTFDYTLPNGETHSLTIAAGQISTTFDVTWADDAIDENDQTLQVSLTNVRFADVSDASGQYTILDDDDAPTISINDVSTSEIYAEADFTVSLSNASGRTITVDYSAPDGGTDTLIFEPGDTEKTFTTTWTDDNITEPDVTEYATISNPTNATILDDTGQLDISDSDYKPYISIEPHYFNEYDGYGYVTISLSHQTVYTATIDYSSSLGSGTITFDPYETSKIIYLIWTDDDIDLSNTDINITLSNEINAALSTGEKNNHNTIIDDDGLTDKLVLNVLDGTQGFGIYGTGENSSYNYSASNLGDINGDGYEDFIIASSIDDYDVYPGSAYVVYGGISIDNRSGEFDLTNFTTDNGFEIINLNTSESQYLSVSNAGDLNNDGYDDILISEALYDYETVTPTITHVIYGGTNIDGGNAIFDILSLSDSDGSMGFTLEGMADGGHSTITVSNAGDFNGDGYDDFLIGERGFGTYGNYTGATHLIYGGENIDGNDGNLPVTEIVNGDGSLGFTMYGTSHGDGSYNELSLAGDVNNDGYDDIIIGSWAVNRNGESLSGEAYVVYGGINVDGGDASITMSEIEESSGTLGFTIAGGGLYNQAGYYISSAGDFNNDGYDDIIVTARPDGGPEEVYLIYGGSNVDGGDGLVDLLSIKSGDGSSGFMITYDTTNQAFYSIASAGDFNGDGIDDIVLGLHNSSVFTTTNGHVSILYGGTNLDGGDGYYDLSSLTDGNGELGMEIGIYDSFDMGRLVSPAGDINNDGYDDIILGAPGYSSEDGLYGATIVIYGEPTTTNVITGDNTDNNLNGTIASERIEGLEGVDQITGGGGHDTIKGGSGDDLLYGGEGNDILYGGEGDDQLYGNEGVDTLIGGNGNDTFAFDSDDLNDYYDGNADYDTLIFYASSGTINLSSIAMNNMEEIDLTITSGNDITLTLQDVIDLTDGNDQFLISGDGNDEITSAGEGWVQGSDQLIDSETYNTYTAGGATLLIDEDIIQDIS